MEGSRGPVRVGSPQPSSIHTQALTCTHTFAESHSCITQSYTHVHVCTHRIIHVISHRYTRRHIQSYIHTGMHIHIEESYSLLTQSYTPITRSHIHTCMYAHTESYSWSHIDTRKHTRSLTYTHKQRHAGDEGDISSRSFSFALASPCLSPWTPLSSPLPGHHL